MFHGFKALKLPYKNGGTHHAAFYTTCFYSSTSELWRGSTTARFYSFRTMARLDAGSPCCSLGMC